MKPISHPPLIILLDILFVFLFMLILEEKKIVHIEVPSESLFKGGQVLYFDKSTNSYYDNIGSKYNFKKKYNVLIDCEKQKQCVDIEKKFLREAFILIPENISDELSKINMLALGKDICNKMRYKITAEGKIDFDSLLADNNCLSKIYGIEKLLVK